MGRDRPVQEQHNCDYCGRPPTASEPVTRDASENWMHDKCRKKFLGIG